VTPVILAFHGLRPKELKAEAQAITMQADHTNHIGHKDKLTNFRSDRDIEKMQEQIESLLTNGLCLIIYGAVAGIIGVFIGLLSPWIACFCIGVSFGISTLGFVKVTKARKLAEKLRLGK
jgi:hypothetical protein